MLFNIMPHSHQYITSETPQYLLSIINWVVGALNADWLKAVVYHTVYHRYDKTCILLL